LENLSTVYLVEICLLKPRSQDFIIWAHKYILQQIIGEARYLLSWGN